MHILNLSMKIIKVVLRKNCKGDSSVLNYSSLVELSIKFQYLLCTFNTSKRLLARLSCCSLSHAIDESFVNSLFKETLYIHKFKFLFGKSGKGKPLCLQVMYKVHLPIHK